jgi:hypothetical protein
MLAITSRWAPQRAPDLDTEYPLQPGAEFSATCFGVARGFGAFALRPCDVIAARSAASAANTP